jgi:hypothetical protein
MDFLQSEGKSLTFNISSLADLVDFIKYIFGFDSNREKLYQLCQLKSEIYEASLFCRPENFLQEFGKILSDDLKQNLAFIIHHEGSDDAIKNIEINYKGKVIEVTFEHSWKEKKEIIESDDLFIIKVYNKESDLYSHIYSNENVNRDDLIKCQLLKIISE